MAGARPGATEKGSAGDVEDAEILGGVVLVRQHVDDEREVDGHVDAEAEPADGHADEEPVEVAGDGEREHRQRVPRKICRGTSASALPILSSR